MSYVPDSASPMAAFKQAKKEFAALVDGLWTEPDIIAAIDLIHEKFPRVPVIAFAGLSLTTFWDDAKRRAQRGK